jgi:hypothetical protein
LVWLLSVTLSAGYQKIFHDDPRIGFLSQAKVLTAKLPDLEKAVWAAQSTANREAMVAAEKAVSTTRTLRFNNLLDAVVAGLFLVLVIAIVVLSVTEWLLLLARRRLAVLHESKPVWLPDYALAEARPVGVLGALAIGLALLRHLSGESDMERTTATKCKTSQCASSESASSRRELKRAYVEANDQRFTKPNRCC